MSRGLDQWSLQCQPRGLERGYSGHWLMREVNKLMCSNSMSRDTPATRLPFVPGGPWNVFLSCPSFVLHLTLLSQGAASLCIWKHQSLLSCFSSEWCRLAMIPELLHIASILVIWAQANPTTVWACRSQPCEVPGLGWQPGQLAQFCVTPETGRCACRKAMSFPASFPRRVAA